MAGKSEPTTRYTLCKICGKPDGCHRLTFPNGNVLWDCRRVGGDVKSTLIGKDGQTYILLSYTKSGIFSRWQEISQYEENRAEFLASLGKGDYEKKPRFQPRAAEPVIEPKRVPSVPLRSADELNEIYRDFLSLLVLEERHKKILLDEWKKVPGLFEKITSTYIIKSIPTVDSIRYAIGNGLSYQNRTRKEIMKKLTAKHPILAGVPGFYQFEDGTWTCSYLSGIVYPDYDIEGRIIRLRCADDFPNVKGQYRGENGIFSFQKGIWYFEKIINDPEEEETKYAPPIPVYSYSNKNQRYITLNKKGYPDGKPQGKYKWFSSEKIVLCEDNVYRNKYRNGCGSGCVASIYMKPGDDMSVVYFTEGEKKAMVANMLLNVPVIHFPGTGNFGVVFKKDTKYEPSIIEELQQKGMEIAVIAYDADKLVNASVLRDERNVVQAFKESGVRLAIGEWSSSWGKGLDDVLLEGIRPVLYMID